MSYDTILLEKEDNIAIIRLNRPKALNAINSRLIAEMTEAVKEVASDKSLRVLILIGAGDKAFVAGADIAELQQFNPLEARLFCRLCNELYFMIENLSIPAIACVNGFALGGGAEMAMACDFIYAADNARFGQPEINLGLIPGFGGTQRLPRLIGKARAKELCMTGGMIDAQEAKEIGLANKIFPKESLWDETIKVAKIMASKGKAAIYAAKETINRGYDMDIVGACKIESDAFALCISTEDSKEGISAFLEKRKPVFKGELP